jgi:asparagine synthase (glutamine-hydrolysing)
MEGLMSAIAGLYHLNKEPVSPGDYNGIMKLLHKYPANDIQVWQKDNIFLGCHTQWITPESVNEQLPFYDYENQIVITSDAIIDNREELYEKLQIDHERRKTLPDSQIILLSYQKWGEDCPKYLIGEFAFMIWDEGMQKFFGARDFSGSRTLYYYQDLSKFAFCTTIEPIFSLSYVKKNLNEQWLAEFLAIPGMNEAVDTTITPYMNINQLPPSHSIRVSNKGVKLLQYCNLTSTETRLKLKSDEEYIEAFQDVFQEAVNSRLRTYLDVGAHLSGGLDSGAVASFAAKSLKTSEKQLHTFSYVPPKDFKDWTTKNRIANERPFIKSTVEYVGNIKDHYFDFDQTNPLSEVTDWLDIMEMPYKFFANSNWIKGIYEKAHEQGIGVLLNGGRGNLSISWGPALGYYAVLLRKFKLLKLFNELNQYSQNVKGNRLRTLPMISKRAFPIINQIIGSEQPYEFPRIINPELAKRTDVFRKLKNHGVNTTRSMYKDSVYDARKRHFEELFTWNATGTLGTKLSLRYGLWKRDPTNDLRVIRFCLSLPEEQYVQNGLDRALIRRATKGHLPENVRLNQTIRGAQGVDSIYRMTPYWNGFIEELEQLGRDPQFKELINTKTLESAISRVRNGPRPEYSLDPEYWILMRSLIVYRFVRNNF